MNKLKKIILVLELSFMAVFTPYIAFAQPNLGGILPSKPSNVPTEFSTIQNAISAIFNFVIVVAGTIFVILILIGGIMYLTSAGNEDGTAKAKKLILDGIIGLIIVLAAWAIGTFILGRLGFRGPGIVSGGSGGGGGTGITLPYTVSWASAVDYNNKLIECRQTNGGSGINLTSGDFNSGAGQCI